VNKRGLTLESFHVYAETSADMDLKLWSKPREEAGKERNAKFFGREVRLKD